MKSVIIISLRPCETITHFLRNLLFARNVMLEEEDEGLENEEQPNKSAH